MKTMRVAVVGAGAAGMYAIESLLGRREFAVEVDLYEILPTPWGLVRAGVAPDHPEKKQVCDRQFNFQLQDPRVRFIGNLAVGRDIAVAELSQWYDTVIYAVGATGDIRMALPGEDLPGCLAAREFVAFYNGHPDFSALPIDLSCERAIVVGNGNVALDIARILATPIAALEKTDIAEHALEALRSSHIREIVVLARRGAWQAAFNNPELEEFEHLAGVDVAVEGDDLVEPGGMQGLASWEAQRKIDTLRRLVSRPKDPGNKRIVFRFLGTPVELTGSDKVAQMRIAHNHLRPDAQGRLQAVPSEQTSTLDAGLVLRAIGYRGTPMPGLPFDAVRGVIRNVQGRVVEDGGAALPGVYTTGWIKRGCRGIIGSNRKCARETVDCLVDDWAMGLGGGPALNKDAVLALVSERQPAWVSLGGWLAIDRHERSTGRQKQRSRVKLTDISSMLEVANAH